MRVRDALAILSIFVGACEGGATARVEPAEIRPTRVVRGIVEPLEGVAHVAVQHTSTVLEIRARLGDRVEEGSVLAVLTLAPGSTLLDDREELIAPIAGTVVALHCARGDTIGPGTIAYELAALDRLVARASVEPSALEGVSVPSPVEVRDGARRAEATLERLPVVRVRESLPLAPLDHGEISARLRLEVPLPPPEPWVPFSEVELRVGAASVRVEASVPRSAIRIADGVTHVELAGGGVREVRLGASDDERVEVFGVEPGAVVRLREGTP